MVSFLLLHCEVIIVRYELHFCQCSFKKIIARRLAFFDEFERQTHGENFSLGAVIAADAEAERMRLVKEKQQSERNELDDFFDEFEKTTQGENFKRKESHNGDT